MDREKSEFCFCTLAFGESYRFLGLELAKDIEKHSPGTSFIVFTDRASDFQDCKNVLVFQHRRRGVLVYHERRFAIAQALSMFNSCIYLDADVRICDRVPDDLKWLPGITAKSCYSILKHHKKVIEGVSQKPWQYKAWEVIQKMAQKLELDLNKDDVKYINEFMFVVTRDSGREIEFLNLWDKLALYADLHGVHKGPGNAIGLAAAKVGFPVRHDRLEGIDFFDDRVEQWRIDRGESDPNAKKEYFEIQKQIENRKKSRFKKITNKVVNLSQYGYHSLRLRMNLLLKGGLDF